MPAKIRFLNGLYPLKTAYLSTFSDELITNKMAGKKPQNFNPFFFAIIC
jgi:hypothetical protein